ncbi:MAG: hypothetical protein NC123_08445 [Butyrivibrio sp.]|nr:hypothetical protein [Butyrivibrio sp.]
MTEVKFYESIEDELLRFAVIISKTQNKYVFCKHKDRATWEVPGGHREQLMDEFPKKWTYPDIQPHLINEAARPGYL